MIRLRIGGADVPVDDEQAIDEQLRNRAAADPPPCVEVDISSAGLDLTLQTRQCKSAGIRGSPTREQARLLELWQERVLCHEKLTSTHLIQFLRHIRDMA
jgi:hypothetical protein